jgi:hypothetical protein
MQRCFAYNSGAAPLAPLERRAASTTKRRKAVPKKLQADLGGGPRRKSQADKKGRRAKIFREDVQSYTTKAVHKTLKPFKGRLSDGMQTSPASFQMETPLSAEDLVSVAHPDHVVAKSTVEDETKPVSWFKTFSIIPKVSQCFFTGPPGMGTILQLCSRLVEALSGSIIRC